MRHNRFLAPCIAPLTSLGIPEKSIDIIPDFQRLFECSLSGPHLSPDPAGGDHSGGKVTSLGSVTRSVWIHGDLRRSSRSLCRRQRTGKFGGTREFGPLRASLKTGFPFLHPILGASFAWPQARKTQNMPPLLLSFRAIEPAKTPLKAGHEISSKPLD